MILVVGFQFGGMRFGVNLRLVFGSCYCCWFLFGVSYFIFEILCVVNPRFRFFVNLSFNYRERI